MRDVRERFDVKRSIQWTESMAEDIQAIADLLNTSFAEVVRSCVQRELPKMRERSRKRKK